MIYGIIITAIIIVGIFVWYRYESYRYKYIDVPESVKYALDYLEKYPNLFEIRTGNGSHPIDLYCESASIQVFIKDYKPHINIRVAGHTTSVNADKYDSEKKIRKAHQLKLIEESHKRQQNHNINL